MNAGQYDRSNIVPADSDKAEQDNMKLAEYFIKNKIQTEHAGVQEDGITELLECHGLSSLGLNEIALYLDTRKVAVMATDAVFRTKDGIPRILYVNFATFQSARKKMIEKRTPVRPLVPNAAAIQLRRKKLRLVQPVSGLEREDSYIAGLLIGLAQQQRVALQASVSGADVAVGATVYAIGVPGMRPRELLFYKACIPSAFLEKWEKPAESSHCEAVEILHTSISLKEPLEAARVLGEVLRSHGLCS